MGYRVLTAQEAAGLPRNGGSLGIDIERAQHLNDSGLGFDIIRIKRVYNGSPGDKAGLNPGDQMIAVDGRVFESLRAFAGYVGSLPPGSQMSVDYIPKGGGPAQAQRVAVTIAARPGQTAPSQESAGMSTGTKVAIGVGAAALFGCYELGCFSRRGNRTPQPQQQGMQPAR